MTIEELIESLTILKEQARNSGANTFVWHVNLDSFNFVLDTAIKALEQEQYYKDLAESYEKTITKLTKAIAEQEPVFDKIQKMKFGIADSLEFWDYSPNNNPLARDMLETLTYFWGDIKAESEDKE